MIFWTNLLTNKIFMASAIAWFTAQVLKTLIHLALTKELTPERLIGSGGMPSSHSSTVCALLTTTAITYGTASFEFAISAIFAIIVMHDAIGVRQETGKQARLLNEMMERFAHFDNWDFVGESLKEFIGHTPLQVFAGAILGFVVGILYMM
ncbi:MAG: divergent PAP2 family protein [Lachnospiraceae bacterium]